MDVFKYQVDSLDELAMERGRMIEMLHFQPTSKDDRMIENQLKLILRLVRQNSSVLDDVSTTERLDLLIASVPEFDAKKYIDELTTLKKAKINAETEKVKLEEAKAKLKANVEENVVDEQVGSNTAGNKHLSFNDAPTFIEDETNFEPYKDEPEEQYNQFPTQSNQDIFRTNQELLNSQDDQLNNLSTNINKTNRIAHGINEDLEDQMHLINNFDNLVNNNANNLNKVQLNLNMWDKLRKERGEYKRFCLIVFLIILLFFLIIML